VEGNELAQQKLKPKLISCWRKCLISLIVHGHFISKPRKKTRISIGPWNRWQRKHQSPGVAFASAPRAPRVSLASTELGSEPTGAVPGCAGCQAQGPAAGGAGAQLHHHRRGRRFLPKLFMSFARLGAMRPAEPSRPFTLCFPACVTGSGIALPALLAVPSALVHLLGLSVSVNACPAKPRLR